MSKRRRERQFKFGSYDVLVRRLYHLCQQRGHEMVHATTWRWRQRNLNEKFWCRHCHQEAFIQYKPPQGYAHLHGVALAVPCVKPKGEPDAEP